MLAEALKDKDLDVRVAAVYSMQNLGPKGMPLLQKELKTAKESPLRQAPLQGMLNYNHRAKEMLGPLTEYLKDGTPQVRWMVCQTLGKFRRRCAGRRADAQDAAQRLEPDRAAAGPGCQPHWPAEGVGGLV